MQADPRRAVADLCPASFSTSSCVRAVLLWGSRHKQTRTGSIPPDGNMPCSGKSWESNQDTDVLFVIGRLATRRSPAHIKCNLRRLCQAPPSCAKPRPPAADG
ncbi:unnamed protein product [Pleuronectes platessa]|uniref:Uncharacterized protein n=1 Tax=Pleuronectes platessa TaxID=8262 RepID=A0A9N7V2L3_PLEPL|nr:unnamed protein product [Pleuronectes platessa]